MDRSETYPDATTAEVLRLLEGPPCHWHKLPGTSGATAAAIYQLAPGASVSIAHEGGKVNHFTVTLPGSAKPRTDLISLHRKLMREGHTCIDRTGESTPSILVVAP